VHISYNKLAALPEGIGFGMTHLTSIFLSNNELTEIPLGLARLEKLTHFNVSNNKLKWLPWRLHSCQNVWTNQNEFVTEPSEQQHGEMVNDILTLKCISNQNNPPKVTSLKEQTAQMLKQKEIHLDNQTLGSELVEYIQSPIHECDFCHAPIYSSFIEKIDIENRPDSYDPDSTYLFAWKGFFCSRHPELEDYFKRLQEEKKAKKKGK